jgi:hypothetical protein
MSCLKGYVKHQMLAALICFLAGICRAQVSAIVIRGDVPATNYATLLTNTALLFQRW